MKNLFLITLFSLLFAFNNGLAKEVPSALLMVCTDLNQPDLKELTVIRDYNIDEYTLSMYVWDANSKLSVTKYDIEDYREGLFVMPDFVNLERHLQREQDGWHIYIYYPNRVLDKLVNCTESPE